MMSRLLDIFSGLVYWLSRDDHNPPYKLKSAKTTRCELPSGEGAGKDPHYLAVDNALTKAARMAGAIRVLASLMTMSPNG